MQLPETFLNEIQNLLPEDEVAQFLSALDSSAPVSIRLNPYKPVRESGREPVLWNTDGCYLAERPAFTFDPLLHAGAYYVQEASSMFVRQAVVQALKSVEGPVRALDLCAAPGGKSTLMLSVLPEDSLLVANEIIRTRANILSENLIKWGLPGVIVTNNEASAFSDLQDAFDLVLTDVPCSGEGMFRKDPDAVGEWSRENVALCVTRQRAIVQDIWPAVKPGGHLIYSTCTYNTDENEENIAWICENLGAEPVEVDVQPGWQISGALGGYEGLSVCRFFPHKTRGEGFFLALLRKPEAEEFQISSRKIKPQKGKAPMPIPSFLHTLLKNSADFDFLRDRSNHLLAFPKKHSAILRMLEHTHRIVHAGIPLGEEKGKDFIPDAALALSVERADSAYPSCMLDLKQAIDFLRKEAVVLPESCPKGWVLVGYQGFMLGWVKNLGNRANNGYPPEWRIRSSNPF